MINQTIAFAVIILVIPFLGMDTVMASDTSPRISDAEIVDFYTGWRDQAPDIKSSFVKAYGADFYSISDADYSHFMASLDLTGNDLMKWSLVTEIPLLVLAGSSDFYYYNTHLMADKKKAQSWSYQQYSRLKTKVKKKTGEIILLDRTGTSIPVTEIPAGTFARVHYENNQGLARSKLNYQVFAPYLRAISEIPDRAVLVGVLKSLPLSFIRTLRGKAMYFMLDRGRSYTLSMPASNLVYHNFAGMVPGIFMERNKGRQIAKTFVHELCHVLGGTVINDRYGNILFPVHYPFFNNQLPKMQQIFGRNDESSLPLEKENGYWSRYAKTNAQENFAEHCMAYLWQKDDFYQRAQAEKRQGYKALATKYDFIEKLITKTPTTHKFLRVNEMKQSVAKPQEKKISQEKSCQAKLASLHNVSSIDSAIESILKTKVACEVSELKEVSYLNKKVKRYYFTAKLSCRVNALANRITGNDFSNQMKKRHYHSFQLISDITSQMVTGSTSTVATLERCQKFL